MDIRQKTIQQKLIIAIAVLGVFSLAFIGYLKATPGAEEQPQAAPKIEVVPKFFDFGNVPFGGKLKHNFIVKNTGTLPLLIKRLATSCGCTSAKISKEEIMPNEEAVLTVIYDTAAMGTGPHGRGNQERIIYIKTNDPLNPQAKIKIHAYVE